MTHFKGKQFKKDVISVAVGYYLRYNLRYREVQELLYDRGLNVCHTTIYRWVQDYSKVRFCCKVFQKIYFSVKLRKKTERTE